MRGQVDLDGNGFINFPEFVTMMRKCKVDTDFDRQIREAFKVSRLRNAWMGGGFSGTKPAVISRKFLNSFFSFFFFVHSTKFESD